MNRGKKNTESKIDESYWSRLDGLIESSEIVIDRPKGTAHSRYPDLIFPQDYGYLKGTTGGDGHGIDVWLGTAKHRRLTAIACTVDMFKKDTEIKLLIGCTEKDIGVIKNATAANTCPAPLSGDKLYTFNPGCLRGPSPSFFVSPSPAGKIPLF